MNLNNTLMECALAADVCPKSSWRLPAFHWLIVFIVGGDHGAARRRDYTRSAGLERVVDIWLHVVFCGCIKKNVGVSKPQCSFGNPSSILGLDSMLGEET